MTGHDFRDWQLDQSQLSELAVGGFAKGYNCAESIVAALGAYLGRDDAPIALATPFGAGFGGRRDLCGILTGGAMVIGLVHGRVEPTDMDRKAQAYRLAGAYWRWFRQQFGTVRCRDIVPGKFSGHTEACERIMAEAATQLATLLDEAKP